MSEIVSLSRSRKHETRMRIGFLRLTDSAPVIVAQEFGFFAEEGIDAELVLEPSWANVADKLTYGFLDAAVIVPPLAFAIELGLRGVAQSLIIPCAISLGGNTITLAQGLAAKHSEKMVSEDISASRALGRLLDPASPLSLGVVHTYSTHNLLLRYWLATGGIDPDRDVKLTVVPPSLAVQALQSGQIAGFCAGAPWGELAHRARAGQSVATSRDIWQNAPEKALAVSARWADQNPDALKGAIRAIVRAAKFCDAPENASYTASLLSRHKYLDADSHAILSSLPGGAIARDNVSAFYRNTASFPWRSQGLWFLEQMKRWGLVPADLDSSGVAARVYRPDIYRASVAGSDIAVPSRDIKSEGTHPGAWQLEAVPEPIPMGGDLFCDRAVFDPPGAALHNI